MSRSGIGKAGAVLALALSLASPALAQQHFDHRGPGRPVDRGPGRPVGRPDVWRGHDIRHFNDHDFALWRGGRWFQGPHDGRNGWWWIVGGIWYFYPAPVYPYPNPYQPPVVAAPAAPGQYYYYCPTSSTYYPYVTVCSVPWQAVPIASAAPSPVPAPSAVVTPPAPPPPAAPPPAPSAVPAPPVHN